MLDESGAANHSGNSVTTLILSIATRPPRPIGRATLRPRRGTSPLQRRAAFRGDTPGGALRPPDPPAPLVRRSGRTHVPLARTPSPDAPREGSPPPPRAVRAACAAARLRGGFRGRCGFAQYAGLLEERTHRVGRRRALLEPGPRLLGVHIDHRWIGARVVIADRHYKAAVARRLGVRDDDPEIGLTLPPHPAQSNSSCHSVPYILLMNLLILRICWNCSSKRFTSWTDRPDPFAIRIFRDPLNTLGSARSSGVIESTIASTCLRRLSSIDTPCSAFALIPGKSPSTCFKGPMFCICFSATRKSCRSMPFLDRTFCSRRLAASASTVATAFSTNATTSPCPRIRPAMRFGSNGSSASVFSPTPTYLIGTPVTPWIDSAAPPCASPSSFVRMTPVNPTAS